MSGQKCASAVNQLVKSLFAFLLKQMREHRQHSTDDEKSSDTFYVSDDFLLNIKILLILIFKTKKWKLSHKK